MNKYFRLSTPAISAIVFLAACGGGDKPTTATAGQSAAPPAAQGTQAMPRSPSPAGAKVFFISPHDGDVVPATFRIEFGVTGMTVVRAGENVPDSGHHHLLIDTDLPDLSLPIPADANHIHFGDGSTSTERTLAPGQHTLQLLFADYLHIPHAPPVYSDRITITVE
jgi:hypothetical protein